MKSILIIDTPKDCGHCRISDFVDGDSCLCRKADRKNNANEKPEWCPLKPMSEEEMVDAIPISFLKDRIALNESWGCYGYAKGLQSAINEWEKQNERHF